jgi:large subunit ribosomal protein L22
VSAVETPRSVVRAEARYVRAAPRKVQLVVEQIRGRTVPEARTILTFLTRDAARDVRKVLDSAVANAEANHGLAGDDLVVTAAYVGEGPMLKRWRARARGRVGRVRRRTCHITMALALPSGEAIPAPIERPPPARVPTEARAEEAAAEEEAPAEEKPKRARRPRQTPEAEAEAGREEAPEPRRTRTGTPKAEEGSSGEKPAAQRKPRARRPKKTDEEGEA